MSERRFTIIIVLIAVFFSFSKRTTAANTTPSLEDWVERLKGLEGHKTVAFKVGPELVKSEPDFGLRVVETAWPELTDIEVKRGLLNAFHFARHPKIIKVLHLGVTDSKKKVKDTALNYLSEYSMQKFSGNTRAYRRWYSEFSDKSLEEIREAGLMQNRPILKNKLEEIVSALEAGNRRQLWDTVREIAKYEDPLAIPTLIGIIDADNSYDTIYGVGYFGLSPLTGVEYSPYHDGAWWRRWWEKNKSRYPEEVQNIVIPDLPKTESGKAHKPYPEELDSLEGKIKWLLKEFHEGHNSGLGLSDIAREIAKENDPRAIPIMIGVIDADNTYDTIYGIGYFGLGRITKVRYKKEHNGVWWRQWWEKNKDRYPEYVRNIEIPVLNKKADPNIYEIKLPSPDADVSEISSEERYAEGDRNKRYFLIGAGKDDKPPKEGYNLIIIMPGGAGGENFNPFVRRIYKNALGDKFLVAQPVAFKWHGSQRIVWPTKVNPTRSQKFATEDFIEAVIRDVKKQHKINKRNIFTLSWSSSGPAAYAISLQKSTQVKGSFIAMSVFRRKWLPPLDTAKGHIYYLLHSPEDKICPFGHAEQAKAELTEAGAIVQLDTYEGGHGWYGDVYCNIKRGISWLNEQVSHEKSPTRR
jgi:predicted esterase